MDELLWFVERDDRGKVPSEALFREISTGTAKGGTTDYC